MKRELNPDGSGSALERMAATELFRHLFHRAPVHARMPVYVFDEPLEHQENLRATGDVRMNSQWKYRPFIFAVYPVELIAPQLFHVARVDEAVAAVPACAFKRPAQKARDATAQGDLPKSKL
jgi:hypothetical protein